MTQASPPPGRRAGQRQATVSRLRRRPLRAATRRLHRFVTRRTDGAPLALARIGVGTAAVAKAALTVPILDRVLGGVALRAPYVTWLPPPPAGAWPVLIALWAAAAIAFTAGWRTRVAGVVLCATIAYVLALDQQLYGNHLYLLLLLGLLLTVGGSGARFSMDARRARRSRRARVTQVATWPGELLKFQVSAVYGFAALAKLNPDYLSGVVLAGRLRTAGPLAFPEPLRALEVVALVSAASAGVELFLAIALWSPRARRAAFAVGAAFHALLVLAVSPPLPLAVFGLEMLAVYPLFAGRAVSGLAAAAATRRARHAGPSTSAPPSPGSAPEQLPKA